MPVDDKFIQRFKPAPPRAILDSTEVVTQLADGWYRVITGRVRYYTRNVELSLTNPETRISPHSYMVSNTDSTTGKKKVPPYYNMFRPCTPFTPRLKSRT